MLPKIPDFILNTSVDFISTAKNADGDVTETPQGAEMCRVEEKPVTIRTESGNLLQLQTMVYLNATAYRIEKGWIVSFVDAFNGTVRGVIDKATPFRDVDGSLHHWELLLKEVRVNGL